MQAGVIDFPAVFAQHRIAYATRGANVGSGEVNVKCPWCGQQDPSFHLGINKRTGAFKCWRNAAHKGRHPLFLLAKLLGGAKAHAVLRTYGVADKPNALQPAAGGDDVARPEEFAWPPGIYAYDRRNPIDRAIAEYMVVSRGFARNDVDAVFSTWNLRIGRNGAYAWRLIIPYTIGTRVLHFTARAISANAVLRYRASPTDKAVVDPSEIIFNADALENSAGVVLSEGAMDAIKMTTYGPLPGVALSTNSATYAQIKQLKRARRIVLLVDNDNVKTHAQGDVGTAGLRLYWQLMQAGIPTITQPMPAGYKDPGAVPWQRYAELLNTDALLAARR